MSTTPCVKPCKPSSLEELIATSTALYRLLPPNTRIAHITPHGTSHWTTCFRVDTLSPTTSHVKHGNDDVDARHACSGNTNAQHEEENEEKQGAEEMSSVRSCFIKIARGQNGMNMLRGEYEAAREMERVLPGFCVKGVGWGVLGRNDAHSDGDGDGEAGEKKWLFYIQDLVHMRRPATTDMQNLVKQLALFHGTSRERFKDLTRDQRPLGMKFGYHITTYNGRLAQDNTWTTTWEEHFCRNMERMLEYVGEGGDRRSKQMQGLLKPLFQKVIPRLLHPMEMDGRGVSPSLCHGDLWEGNVGVVGDGDEEGHVMVFDPVCFWGHGEYDLRSLNKLQRDAYLRHIPATYPGEDFEARIMLYHLRSCLHDCALFPEERRNRERFVEEARVLVDMFPGGLEGWMGEMKDEKRVSN